LIDWGLTALSELKAARQTLKTSVIFLNLSRNDLYCVGWGVKLYSLTHSLTRLKKRAKRLSTNMN